MANIGSELKERDTRIKQRRAALANQRDQRAVKKDAASELHEVDRNVHRSIKQEVAASQQVVKPPKRHYMQPSFLPGMPELPGYHLEYVRRDNRNRGDCANISAHLRSGWEVCRKSDFAEEHLPTVRLTDYGDCIGNDDTILMKIHEELWAEREAMVNGKRDSITNAINRRTPSLDVSHPHMPLYTPDVKNEHEVTMPRVRVRPGVNVASD